MQHVPRATCERGIVTVLEIMTQRRVRRGLVSIIYNMLLRLLITVTLQLQPLLYLLCKKEVVSTRPFDLDIKTCFEHVCSPCSALLHPPEPLSKQLNPKYKQFSTKKHSSGIHPFKQDFHPPRMENLVSQQVNLMHPVIRTLK